VSIDLIIHKRIATHLTPAAFACLVTFDSESDSVTVAAVSGDGTPLFFQVNSSSRRSHGGRVPSITVSSNCQYRSWDYLPWQEKCFGNSRRIYRPSSPRFTHKFYFRSSSRPMPRPASCMYHQWNLRNHRSIPARHLPTKSPIRSRGFSPNEG